MPGYKFIHDWCRHDCSQEKYLHQKPDGFGLDATAEAFDEHPANHNPRRHRQEEKDSSHALHLPVQFVPDVITAPRVRSSFPQAFRRYLLAPVPATLDESPLAFPSMVP